MHLTKLGKVVLGLSPVAVTKISDIGPVSSNSLIFRQLEYLDTYTIKHVCDLARIYSQWLIVPIMIDKDFVKNMVHW